MHIPLIYNPIAGTSNPYLSIQAYTLNPVAEYYVMVVMATLQSVGYATYPVSANPPPYNGRCDINPKTGEIIQKAG